MMSDQEEPKLDQNPASDGERLAGIVAQTRADLGEDDDSRVLAMLRQRIEDAGIDVSDALLSELVDKVRRGDAGDFAGRSQ